MNSDKHDMEITLPLLQALEEERHISQRKLAKRLGVALGLTNAFLKRCVRKGLIKVEQIPANRYAYYLTPKGFAEKSRLTAHYLSNSFKFYRTASAAYRACFEFCLQQGWNNAYLCGVSELSEIALLQAMQAGVTVDAIFDPGYQGGDFFSKIVFTSEHELRKDSVFLVTAVGDDYKKQLLSVTQEAKILQPKIL